jgi:hypothetical protein
VLRGEEEEEELLSSREAQAGVSSGLPEALALAPLPGCACSCLLPAAALPGPPTAGRLRLTALRGGQLLPLALPLTQRKAPGTTELCASTAASRGQEVLTAAAGRGGSAVSTA